MSAGIAEGTEDDVSIFGSVSGRTSDRERLALEELSDGMHDSPTSGSLPLAVPPRATPMIISQFELSQRLLRVHRVRW